MNTKVFGTGLAAAGTVEAGHGFASAGVEGLAENVFSAGFDGFCCRHTYSSKYPTFAGEVRGDVREIVGLSANDGAQHFEDCGNYKILSNFRASLGRPFQLSDAAISGAME